MATQKKIETVKNLTDKVSRAKAIVFADYRGLKHKQLEDLRKLLKKVEAELIIAKNRLMLRSLTKQAKEVEQFLQGSTATLFNYADEITPLKELLKFFKAAGMGKTKGGLLGTQIITEEAVTKLASLPTRQVLLAKLVGQLNAPVQGFHYALSWNINKLVWAINKIKDQK